MQAKLMYELYITLISTLSTFICQGYKRNSVFIVTQAPMKETIPDFWRMIWEQESQSIVLLCITGDGVGTCYEILN